MQDPFEQRLINIQSYKLGLMLELILETLKHFEATDPEKIEAYRKRLHSIISLKIKDNEKDSDFSNAKQPI